jgi:hypothetical protein
VAVSVGDLMRVSARGFTRAPRRVVTSTGVHKPSRDASPCHGAGAPRLPDPTVSVAWVSFDPRSKRPRPT